MGDEVDLQEQEPEYNWGRINVGNRDFVDTNSSNVEQAPEVAVGDGVTTQGDTSAPQPGSEPEVMSLSQATTPTKQERGANAFSSFKDFLKLFENDKGNLNIAGAIGVSMLKGLGQGMMQDKQLAATKEEKQKDRDFQEKLIKDEREAKRIKTTTPNIQLPTKGMINYSDNNPYRPTGMRVS